MKLAVSNIAWGKEELPRYLNLLRQLGCEGIELAASLLWPEPADASVVQRREIRKLIVDSGLKTVGLHALLFTRPDLTLFETVAKRTATRDYLRNMFELCRDLRGRTLVFGSPNNRSRGNLPISEANKVAQEFFYECAEDAQAFGAYLLIEPLTPYETNFIRSSDEGAALVRQVRHPHFQLELDGRVMAETDGDYSALARFRDILMHVQTSDPGLTVPGSTGLDHAPIGAVLRASGYEGFVTLEMRRDAADTDGAIRRGVEALKEHYLVGVRV